MDVSILIVNYNTANLVVQCLKSVYEKTSKVIFEIIVVDNASPNDDVSIITDEFPSVKLVLSEENLGFGRANNLGAQYAKGKYLLLLNPDTYLLNNAIYELWRYIEKHEKVSVVGGNLYSEDMQPNISFDRSFPGCMYEINNLLLNIPSRLRYGKCRIFNYTSHILDVAYVVGADLMIRKSDFNAVNGFDPNFFMYFEEVDLCYRIKRNNGKVISLPSAKIVHLEGKASVVKYKQILMTMESLIYFYKKNSCFFIVFFLYRFNQWLRYLLFSKLIKSEKKELFKLRLKALAELRG